MFATALFASTKYQDKCRYFFLSSISPDRRSVSVFLLLAFFYAAAIKRSLFDFGHAGGEIDTCQTCAAKKCTLPDFAHTIGDNDTGQIFAVLKGIIPNFGN